MNNLLLRAITGLIFVAGIVCSIWFNQYVALGVFSLFFIAGIFEYANLFKNHHLISLNKVSFVLSSILIFSIFVSSVFFNLNGIFLLLIFPIIFFVMVLELWRKKQEPILNIGSYILGIFYLVVPFALFVWLIKLNTQANLILIGMFFLIWTNDTFAYLTGRLLGKTKLFERISPNKTWEGTIGGVFFTVLLAFFLGFSNGGNQQLFWIVSALIIAPTAIVGDLLESLFKRNLNIKDSGTILPGHGGILDRFDASLFAVPFYFSWVMIYSNYFSV